jgi:hypothetical protein
MSARGWRQTVALILAVAALPAALAIAQPAPNPAAPPPGAAAQPEHPAQREDITVRSPDAPPSPPPQMGLLETGFPALREAMSELPPFFRDTDLKVRLRTFYFNRQNDNDTASEAWALGGWVQYASGWLLDTFAIGSIASPWGSWPGYLSLMVTDFDRANEKAFGVGTKYDFGGRCCPSKCRA